LLGKNKNSYFRSTNYSRASINSN